MTTTRADIDNFLAQRRLAMVGVSRNPKDFSRGLFRELRRRGYDVIPINPHAGEIEGKPCCARLQDVLPPVEAALLMTSPTETEQVVHDCAESGVRCVWMYRGAHGPGAVSSRAVEFCREHGIRVVEGHCPFMFLPGTPFFHRVHGFLLKLTGHYPASTAVGA